MIAEKKSILEIDTMPIPYKERRRRRHKLVEELPPSLRDRIALRNVEAVTKFSSQTQEILAEALDAGIRISVVIPFLKENPDARVEEIIQACQETTDRPRPNAKKGNQTPPGTQDIATLADLLQTCYPDMPRMTAEAMAGSELLSEVLSIICAQRVCFESRHAESDFVVIVLCGLALRTIERLNQIIPKRPIYLQALQQSGVKWPY
ncbi:MAG: hypothetical protein PVG14_00180 [Anaerolineales bacterium]|jgi:hypothetical protein